MSTPDAHSEAELESTYDAIVIGGGYAGVRAVRDLAGAGHRTLLLEARDRFGGRTLARTFPGSSKRVELGGAWVAPHLHPLIAAEMERYGLELAAQNGGGAPRFQWRSGGVTLPGFPIEGDELYDLERALFQIISDAHRIADPAVPRDLQDVADLDVPVSEYLDRLSVGPRTHEFLATWGALGSGAEPERWSALNALSLVAASGYSAYAWYGAVTEKLAGGSISVIDAMIADAEPDVRLATVVERVAQDADGVSVSTADGSSFRASVAVVAVPLNLWSEIEFSPPLSAAKSDAADTGHVNRIRKCWVLVEGGAPDTVYFGAGDELLWLSPEAEIDGATLMVGFTAPPSTLDVTDTAAIERAVRAHIPGADVVASEAHDWSADPFAQGGWAGHPPGRLSRSASQLRMPEDRICFAGADIAICWIGWLEGALETGARAAEDALAVLARSSVASGAQKA